MTWNDLLDRLKEWEKVYPDKMDESVVFYSEMDEVTYTIDETELVDMNEAPVVWDCNVGNLEMTQTLALIP